MENGKARAWKTLWRRVRTNAFVWLIAGIAALALPAALGMVLRLRIFSAAPDAFLATALHAIIQITLFMCCYVLYVRWVEQRRPSELGRPFVSHVALGLALGSLVMGLTMSTIGLAGEVRLTPSDHPMAALPTILLMVVGAVFEELVFRAVLYRIVELALGTTIALICSALFFGFAHSFNPNATPLSSIAIAVEAGPLLAIVFVLTRRLWAPIALHFAWNTIEGPLLGTPVSGQVLPSVWISHPGTNQWVTGGDFGPEASVPAILWAVLIFALLAAYARHSGAWISFKEARRARTVQTDTVPATAQPA